MASNVRTPCRAQAGPAAAHDVPRAEERGVRELAEARHRALLPLREEPVRSEGGGAADALQSEERWSDGVCPELLVQWSGVRALRNHFPRAFERVFSADFASARRK